MAGLPGVVHHDLWIRRGSQAIAVHVKDGTPAIAINTKMGHVFVLNRLTGAPLLPVEERPVPQSDITGEAKLADATLFDHLLVPEKFEPSDAWGPSPADVQWCQDKIKASRSEGIFTPPSLQGTVVVPEKRRRRELGSGAYDPKSHLMIVNTNRLVAWVKLIPRIS